MAEKNYEYTLNMHKLFEENFSELKSYYCREDIALALDAFKNAPKDAGLFRMRDLRRLCSARGMDAEKLIEDETLLDTVPTRKEIQTALLDVFYDMYKKSPAAENFMERIVRRLAPEYSSDTVRTVILKMFIKGGGERFKRFKTKLFIEWAKNLFDSEEKKKFLSSTDEQKTELIVSKINDNIFNCEPIHLTGTDIIHLMAKSIIKYKNDVTLDFDGFEFGAKAKSFMSSLMAEYNLAEEQSDSENIVKISNGIYEKIIPEEYIDKNSDLADCLEDDFRSWLKELKIPSENGSKGTVNTLYGQDRKSALKEKRRREKKNNLDLELLDLCNDLATGNFRVNGKTRIYLYYFAFMFGMSVPLDGKKIDDDRNIVKNLFHDYYNDNLIRLLTGDYADSAKLSSLENEPTGEGINYKSFVEVIYIYFLCHDEYGSSPGERIDKAEETIIKCSELAKKRGNSKKADGGLYTVIYLEKYINELLNLEVDRIAEYVWNNYTVISPQNPYSAKIMVSAEENTASEIIDYITDRLEENFDINPFEGYHSSELTEEIKEDILLNSDIYFDWKVKDLLKKRFSEDKKFIKLVDALDNRVHIKKGRFNKAERQRMLVVLHILATQTEKHTPISMRKIKDFAEESGVFSAGMQLANAINTLKNIGFDIYKTDSNNYYLGDRVYGDELMDKLTGLVSKPHYQTDSNTEKLLAEVMSYRLKADKRITRSELIALHFNFYISSFGEDIEMDTFPDVFRDYSDRINPHLEDARYQPLSEKNIFDMYVVTELYFYLSENYGYFR